MLDPYVEPKCLGKKLDLELFLVNLEHWELSQIDPYTGPHL